MKSGSTSGTFAKSIFGSVAALAALGAIAVARFQMGPEWLLDPMNERSGSGGQPPMVARSTMVTTDNSLDAEVVKSVENRVPSLTEGLTESDGLLRERHAVDAQGRLVATLFFQTQQAAEKWFHNQAKAVLGPLLRDQTFPKSTDNKRGEIMVLVTLTPRTTTAGVLDAKVQEMSMQVFQVAAPEINAKAS